MHRPLSTLFLANHESQVPLQVLEELASLHEVPRLMQDFRSAGKFLSDFVEPLSRRARGLSPGTPGTVRPLPSPPALLPCAGYAQGRAACHSAGRMYVEGQDHWPFCLRMHAQLFVG